MGPQAMPRTNMDRPSTDTILESPNSDSICWYVAVYMELAQVLL